MNNDIGFQRRANNLPTHMTNSFTSGIISKDHQNILPRKHALNREEIKEIVKVIRNHMALLSILIFPYPLTSPRFATTKIVMNILTKT